MKRLACLLLLCGLLDAETTAAQENPVRELARQGVAAIAPVFLAEAPLKLRLEAPYRALFRSRGDDAEYFPATLYWQEEGSGASTALRVKTRGNTRNRESICRFAPLMLNFPRGRMDGTPFAGENRLKLVTHCQPRARYRQYLLLEYLNYRILNLLSEDSLRVRLLDIEYVDSDNGRTVATAPAFLIEDLERFAERRGLALVSEEKLERAAYRPAQELLAALFQYLIGNADWSLVVGEPGADCCHNIHPLRHADGSLLALPFDFDVSGLVNPRYALPARQLGQARLTQRLYRGACPEPAALEEAVQYFVERRDDIEALYALEGLSRSSRDKSLAFIDQFYAIVTDPAQRKERILGACL